MVLSLYLNYFTTHSKANPQEPHLPSLEPASKTQDLELEETRGELVPQLPHADTHFQDKEIGTQIGAKTCPRTHSE